MLNRTLVKTALFSNMLLLFVLAGHSEGVQPPPDTTVKNNDTVLLDLSLLEPKLPVVENEQAPKIQLNKQAIQFVERYLAKNSEDLERIRKKSVHSFSVINTVLDKYNLPTELKYLAVVESELKTTAVSKAGAVGTWQLMPATARIFSLKVSPKYDERKLLYKSTVAAARYLNDLYDIFGDWLLVIAAYNSGPAPVLKAIKRSGSRDFWKLQYFLPAETRGHVKRFIGTHYFFEGKAGLTTLTKAETVAYNEATDAFMAKQNIAQAKEIPEDEQPVENKVVKTTTVGILQDEE